MLRGNYPAKVDEKGRLKIPALFLKAMKGEYSGQFYVTSLNGDFVRIYPYEVWSRVEAKVAQLGSFNKTKRKFLNRANYFGQLVTMDKQGRVLIPAVLREAAQMRGEVDVLGGLTYLEVWNHQRFVEEIKKNPITPEDEKTLDELGL
jgi:MraZ protein